MADGLCLKQWVCPNLDLSNRKLRSVDLTGIKLRDAELIGPFLHPPPCTPPIFSAKTALKLKLTPNPNRDLLYRPALPPYRVTLHAARVGTCFKHAVFLRCGAEAAFGPVFADFNVVTPTP